MFEGATVIPKSPVWIAGTGARTPLGMCSESTSAAVRAGITTLAEHPVLTDTMGEPVRMSVDPFLDADMPVAQRLAAMLDSAVSQLDLSGLTSTRRLRLLVIASLPEARYDRPALSPEIIAAMAEDHLGEFEVTIRIVSDGHAGGLLAFGVAASALEAAQTDLAIVIGLESFCDRHLLFDLDEAGDLKSEENRDGFFPGEGAGVCLLGGTDVLRHLGLTPLAQLSAITAATEPVPLRSEDVCTGEGLSAAFLAAEALIEQSGIRISDTFCDLNGVRYRNEELMYSILRAQHLWDEASDYTHPADCWGDMGAASGPLFATLAISAHHKGYAKGSRTALWAGSKGGRRALCLLDFPTEQVTS